MTSTLPAVLPFTLGAAAPTEATTPRSVASWEWLLCDGNGNALADLSIATGRMLTFKRNYYAEAQFTISHEDLVAFPFLEAVEHGPLPTLRCYRRSGTAPSGTLVFNGYCAPFTETLDEQGRITAIFRSPFGRLLGDGGSDSGRYTRGGITAEEKYADDIAASLVKLYGGAGTVGAADPTFNEAVYEEKFPVGLGIGNISQTNTRFITYRNANVGQAIIYLSQMTNGFDFDETFVESGATMALFNTYSSIGSLREAARFQYGPGTLANVAKVERVTAPPRNKIRLIGGSGVITETEEGMKESQERFGKWESQQATTGTPLLGALEARAKGYRRANPIRTMKIEPDLAMLSCPKPWDDFFIGDTVPFYGRRGAFEENTVVRVNELQVVIDDNGYETTSIPDPANPLDPDALHSSFTVETGNATS